MKNHPKEYEKRDPKRMSLGPQLGCGYLRRRHDTKGCPEEIYMGIRAMWGPLVIWLVVSTPMKNI